MLPAKKFFYLNFHGIGNPKHPISNAEKTVWVTKDSFIEFCQFAAENQLNIIITFDDGNISDYEIAYPALKQFGLKGIFFILLGRIDRNNYLHKHHLTELYQNKMKIGLHGRNHVDWSKLDKKELTDEIITAKNELEDILGNPVEDAACPYGKYNRVVLKTLKKAKYKHIYTSDKGITSNKNWLISRNSVHNNENVEMYKNRIREELKIISIQKSIKFVKKLIKRYR